METGQTMTSSDTTPRRDLETELRRPGRSAGLMCRHCHSMYVDPLSRSRIRCADCGHETDWPGADLIALRQGSEASDFRAAVSRSRTP